MIYPYIRLDNLICKLCILYFNICFLFEVSENTLECDEDERINITADMAELNVTKLIPFPEPGTWYLGLQVSTILFTCPTCTIRR